MSVKGLGLDICSVERLRRILEGPRGQRFLERVFTDAERATCSARTGGAAAAAYAARFAAKEALTKALGAPAGLRWRDMEVVRGEGGPPTFRVEGVARAELERRGLEVLLTMTHDAGVAAATVVLQERGR